MQVTITKYLGLPFEDCKCWDLVQRVYAENGINLENYTEYAKKLKGDEVTLKNVNPWEKVEIPKQGDVLVFTFDGKTCSHTGVYLDYGKVLHSVVDVGVCVEPLTRYADTFRGAYRYNG